MKIGIIGAGAMAQGITLHAIKAGYEVMLSNSRGPQSLSAQSKHFSCVVGTVEEAIAFGDIVIIAIPLFKYQTLPQSALSGKIVLDLLNYFPQRDGNIPALQNGLTTSELLAKHLHDARLVKAFNSITAEDLRRDSRPKHALERRAMPIAGDDVKAKKIATEFINDIGFDVVDAGSLSESWRFERFRPVYCTSLTKEMLHKTLLSTERHMTVPDGYWLYNRQALA